MKRRLARNPNLAGTRIGLIIPSVNATIEPEFCWMAPRGVSFHSARILLRDTTPEGLRAMNHEVAAAARLLASLGPAAVAYACTSGSFLDGRNVLERMVAELESVVNCPVIATSAAMVEALRILNVRRLALATPYIDSLTEAERRFLEDCGFQIVAWRGLGLSGAAIREVPPEQVFDLAVAADHPEAEAVYISCTDLRAVEVIRALETVLGKAILTSNQVTLWALLRVCGLSTDVEALGSYLTTGETNS